MWVNWPRIIFNLSVICGKVSDEVLRAVIGYYKQQPAIICVRTGWSSVCKCLYLYPVGANSEASVHGIVRKHLNNSHMASHLSSYSCIPRNVGELSQHLAEWRQQVKTMQPDPAPTLDATIMMVSHAGLGPYNPHHIIGIAPVTLLTEWNDSYEAAVKEIELFLTHYCINFSAMNPILVYLMILLTHQSV